MTIAADLAHPPLVVDASALVTVVASGGASATALAHRLAAASLHSPHTLPAETHSALRGLARGGKLTLAQADAARRSAVQIPVELWAWDLIAARAWEMRENLTIYDAGYIALAERIGATLITRDARLARAPGIRCPVAVSE